MSVAVVAGLHLHHGRCEVTGQTHAPAEWLAFLSLGGSAVGVIAFAVAFADADLAYFDPRPLLARAVDRLLVEVIRGRQTVRDAAISLAALLKLLTAPTKGATR